MKRRKFLGLFGGAIAAPMMPLPAVAKLPAAYSKTALHGALMVAQTRGAFSVFGLAQAVKVPVEQAETLMADLARRGVIGPLQGTTFGGRWAKSNVLIGKTTAASSVRHIKENGSDTSADRQSFAEPDLSTLIAHLRRVCQDYGMTLHPRCAQT